MASLGVGLLRSAIRGILLLGCTTGLLLWATVALDRRSIRQVGLGINHRWPIDAGVGIAVGGAIPTAAIGIGLLGGWIAVSGPGDMTSGTYLQDLGLALVITLSIAVTEELVFRGHILTNALEGLHLRWLSQPATIAPHGGVLPSCS